MPEDSSCETGWLQFRQDKCYRFVHIRLAFDDAESLCNNLYGGHLPSIHSQEEQFMISQFLASVNVKNGSEIWLGGRQMDFHNFNWGDGSLFNYSYWEHGEPNFPAEKCIEMSWRNGRWNDINCRLKRAVLCERQVTSRHQIKPNLYQPTTCLDSNCTASAGSSAASTIADQPALIGGAGVQQAAGLPDQVVDSARLPITGQNGSSAFNSHQQAMASLEQSGNSSLMGLLNRTSANGEANMMLPPDDRPIKVITSIMHREQPTVEPLLLPPALQPNETLSGEQQNGTNTFIHYNLPPPSLVGGGESLGQEGSSASSLQAQIDTDSMMTGKSGKDSVSAETLQVSPQPSETSQPQARVVVSSTTQQTFDTSLALNLLDKVKPEANSLLPTINSTSTASSSNKLSTSNVSITSNKDSTTKSNQPPKRESNPNTNLKETTSSTSDTGSKLDSGALSSATEAAESVAVVAEKPNA